VSVKFVSRRKILFHPDELYRASVAQR